MFILCKLMLMHFSVWLWMFTLWHVEVLAIPLLKIVYISDGMYTLYPGHYTVTSNLTRGLTLKYPFHFEEFIQWHPLHFSLLGSGVRWICPYYLYLDLYRILSNTKKTLPPKCSLNCSEYITEFEASLYEEPAFSSFS